MKVQHYAHPLYFIGTHECLFHKGTSVGKYVISTVGDYHPFGTHGLQHNIGCGRTYETCVFNWDGGRKDCGCPKLNDLSEIDGMLAHNELEASANHDEMVRRYTKKANARKRARP